MGEKFYKIINDNSLNMLKYIEKGSVDVIICDPPYELNFMGKSWDRTGIAFNTEIWSRCNEVLKDGGYLLAFGGSRTFHRIACAIEDSGFEIRDTLMWLYGSGFPKSQNMGKSIESKILNGSANTKDFKKLDGEKVESGNWGLNKLCKEQGYRATDYAEDKHLRVDKVNYKTELGKEWAGYGTCLKPAYEPIIVARKQFKGTLVDNVLENRIGALNIDECRVRGEDTEELQKNWTSRKANAGFGGGLYDGKICKGENCSDYTPDGRFPANVIHDGSAEVVSGFPNTKGNKSTANFEKSNQDNPSHLFTNIKSGNHFDDSGSVSRYFYCAKASRKDRDEGLDEFEEKGSDTTLGRKDGSKGASWSTGKNDNTYSSGNAFAGAGCPKKNIHPTVKPTELMQYLVRLVAPKGATILDPFNGSGSTGKAVAFENKERDANYKYIGIELNKEYCDISKARIEWAMNLHDKEHEMLATTFIELEKENK